MKISLPKSNGDFRKNEISVKRGQSVEFKFDFGKIGVKSLLHIHATIGKKIPNFLFSNMKFFSVRKISNLKNAVIFSPFLKFFDFRDRTKYKTAVFSALKKFQSIHYDHNFRLGPFLK